MDAQALEDLNQRLGGQIGSALGTLGEPMDLSELGNVAATFQTDEQAIDHFIRHGGDFGLGTAAEYVRQASEFLTGELEEGVVEGIRAGGGRAGDTVRFNMNNGAFGVLSRDGFIRTYFVPLVDQFDLTSPETLDYFIKNSQR